MRRRELEEVRKGQEEALKARDEEKREALQDMKLDWEKQREMMAEMHALEMTDASNKMEHEMRLKLGEERARSARVVERTRDEKEREQGEKWKSAIRELKRAHQVKVEESERAWEQRLVGVIATKKEALVKEASKWEAALEKAVEEGEKRR